MFWRALGIGMCLLLAACSKRTAVTGQQVASAGSSSQVPSIAPGNSASARPGDPTICVGGHLATGEPEEGSSWIITDGAGVRWKVVNSEIPDAAGSDRKSLETHVAAIGRRVSEVRPAGILVLDLRTGSCPEGVAGGL